MATSELDALLKGAIDMHVHHGPDGVRKRRVDAVEAARQAADAGMRAIVLKSHSYPTAPLAIVASQLVPGIATFGSVSLDVDVGGLNPHAVGAAGTLGAKVAWMPTSSAANARPRKHAVVGSSPAILSAPGSLTVLDGDGRLLPEAEQVLATVKHFEMVLASGHLAPEETLVLVSAARKLGLDRIVITHPLEGEIVYRPFSHAQLSHLVDLGAYVELSFLALLPNVCRSQPQELAEAVRAFGPEHCLMTTDLGQAENPPPVEGMRMFMAALLSQGITESEIETMCKRNPAKLLGLD